MWCSVCFQVEIESSNERLTRSPNAQILVSSRSGYQKKVCKWLLIKFGFDSKKFTVESQAKIQTHV